MVKYKDIKHHVYCCSGLILIWITVAAMYHLLKVAKLNTAPPALFPISLVAPEPHRAAIYYGAFFGLVLLLFNYLRQTLTTRGALALGTVLIIAGNLMQGGILEGLVMPFVNKSTPQYYHDALVVSDWRTWLATFTQNQSKLSVHAETHPPFAVLVHVLLLRCGGLPLLVGTFLAVIVLQIALFGEVLRSFGVKEERIRDFLILYALLPAVNIYSLVCLDSLIAYTATIALLGLARIMHEDNPRPGSILLLGCGILAMSLLTFASLFLVGLVACLLALTWVIDQRLHPLWLPYLLVLVAVVSLLSALNILEYNHLRAFVYASHVENPEGFRLFARPIEYLLTRIEGIGEILFFFSFSGLAILIQYLRESRDYSDPATQVVSAAGIMLFLLFASGAFRTGETARVCLFFYPYILLFLKDISETNLRLLMAGSAIQTIGMQAFANFYW